MNAQRAISASDQTRSLRQYRLLVEQRHAFAQFTLGVMYDLGKGAPKDVAEAAKWYRLAAEHGNAEAQFRLGTMYRTGLGVLQDVVEAAKWCRLAAEQGNADAQYHFGLMYRYGHGVSRNEREAAKWFRIGEEQMSHTTRYCAKKRQASDQQMQPTPETASKRGTACPLITHRESFKDFSSLRNMVKSDNWRTDFVYQLTSYFPEVAALIDEGDFGILHLEVGAMTVATREAIKSLDFYTALSHFVFIGKLFERADTELQNGIQISYLENLLLGETSLAHMEARDLLPQSLKEALMKSESHFERLGYK